MTFWVEYITHGYCLIGDLLYPLNMRIYVWNAVILVLKWLFKVYYQGNQCLASIKASVVKDKHLNSPIYNSFTSLLTLLIA